MSWRVTNEAPNKVQLFFWVELMYYLGFDAFRQVALQFHDKPYDNGELSDEKKWEWVMNAFSKVTGKNMGPFFKIWRTPVSERAAGRMKDLPAWLPSKDYPACYTAEESEGSGTGGEEALPHSLLDGSAGWG